MSLRSQVCWFWLLALLVSVALAPAAHSQQKQKGGPSGKGDSAKGDAKAKQEATKQEKNLAEARILLDAYVLLAKANHDYDGHRIKAMHQIEAAIKILDASVWKKGNPRQKEAAAAEKQATEVAKEAAKKDAAVHEDQAVSDAQLRKAAELLLKISDVLAKNKQNKPLDRVKKALLEIDTALKIR